MDMKKNGVDVSSFLLVEESADSEVDSLTCEMCRHDLVMAGDEDDAESCSCDTSDIHAGVLQKGFDYDEDEDEDFSDVDYGDEYNEVDQLQLNCKSCKMWWSDAARLGYMSTQQQQQQQRGEEEYSSWDGINISRKVKDEMEDRLFWETCMAVGYP